MEKKLPEIKFKELLLNPLKIEAIPFKVLAKNFNQPLGHDPYQPHRLKFNAILFVSNGKEGVHQIDFKKYTYSKGSVILVSKEQIHSYINLPDNNDGFLLVFTEELFLEVGASYPFLINHLYNNQLYSPVFNLENKKFKELKILFSKIKKEVSLKKTVNNEIAKSYFKILLLELFST